MSARRKSRRYRAHLLLGALALTVFILAIPSVASAAGGSISGRVAHGGSEPAGDPEVLVCAIQEEGQERVQDQNCELTNANGEYTIENLSPGSYKIEFWPGALLVHLIFEYFDDTRSWSEARWIQVSDGPVTGIDAELTKSGFITGTVTRASDGTPLSGVLICAEEPLQEFSDCTETEAAGQYQFYELLEGDYLIEFIPTEDQGVRAQYYDGKSKLSAADLVHVATGAATESIDAALLPEAVITGRVTDWWTHAGLGEIEVCAYGLAGPEVTVCEYTEPSGSYELTDLPTGPYKVGFFSESVEEEEESLAPGLYPVQFWDHRASWATANTLALGFGTTVGIDAELGFPFPSAPPSAGPSVAPVATPSRPRRCRPGSRLKRVKGKKRCVKVRKHRKRNHHHRNSR